jgi:Flp pilus assembly protein TadD
MRAETYANSGPLKNLAFRGRAGCARALWLFLSLVVAGCMTTHQGVFQDRSVVSSNVASWRAEIEAQAESLRYSNEVTSALADLILSWDGISARGTGESDRLTAKRIVCAIQSEIAPDERVFDLADVVQRRRANCLGCTQLFWIIGRSLGLSVVPIDVLELRKPGPSPIDAHHVCCLVTSDNGAVMMVDPASPGFVSPPFILDAAYTQCDNGLKLKDGSVPAGLHRRIRVLDEEGLVAHVYNSRGVDLVSQDRFAEAIELYAKAIELNPSFAEAWNNRGVARNKSGRPLEALSDYDRALELDPAFVEVFNNRAAVRAGLGQSAEALADCASAERLNPACAAVYNTRATVYHRLGRLDEAIRDYRRAIELDPELVEAYYNRANAYGKLGQYRKAARDYSQAIRHDSSIEPAYINRALCYILLGRRDAAKRDLLRAVALDPSPSNVELVTRISDRASLELTDDPTGALAASR